MLLDTLVSVFDQCFLSLWKDLLTFFLLCDDPNFKTVCNEQSDQSFSCDTHVVSLVNFTGPSDLHKS